MKNKFFALLLAGIIVSGLMYSHPAYAHNFGGDASASWLSKVQNIKAEMSALKMDLSDSKAVDWHIDKLGEYWNSNDTNEMQEKNQLLAKEIPDTIDAITAAAKQPSPDAADIQQKIDTLGGYLDESISARINKDQLQNATVQGLAVTGIISETLEDYAAAIGTDVDLNDMSNIMGSGGNMTGMSGNMSESSGTSSMGSSRNTVSLVKGAGASANADCVSTNDCFTPNPITVSPGTEVVWKNDDTVGHTVTSGKVSDEDAGSLFDSGIIRAGGTYKFTFDKEGTYDYFCQVHPWMTGQVVVKSGGSTSGMNMGTSYHDNGNTVHFVMDMQSGGSMSGTSDSSSGMTMTIANVAAYRSAQMLASAAKNYYENTVMPLAPSDHSSEAQAADDYFGKLVDAINNKADGNTIMTIVHLHLHTNLIPAFGLPTMTMNMGSEGSMVPEFPMPVLLVIISIIGVIAVTRFGPKLR